MCLLTEWFKNSFGALLNYIKAPTHQERSKTNYKLSKLKKCINHYSLWLCNCHNQSSVHLSYYEKTTFSWLFLCFYFNLHSVFFYPLSRCKGWTPVIFLNMLPAHHSITVAFFFLFFFFSKITFGNHHVIEFKCMCYIKLGCCKITSH